MPNEIYNLITEDISAIALGVAGLHFSIVMSDNTNCVMTLKVQPVSALIETEFSTNKQNND